MPVPNQPVVLLDVIPEQPDDEGSSDTRETSRQDVVITLNKDHTEDDLPIVAESTFSENPSPNPVYDEPVYEEPSILQSGIGDIESAHESPTPSNDPNKESDRVPATSTETHLKEEEAIDQVSETNVSRNTSRSQLSRAPSWLKPKVDYVPCQQWQLQGGNSTLTSNRTVSISRFSETVNYLLANELCKLGTYLQILNH